MGASLGLLVGFWLLCGLIAITCWSHWSADRLGRAERHANVLLREILSEAHYQQVLRFGYLEVNSPSIEHRVHRIPGAGGLVKVYERGCPIMEWCLQPTEPLPDADVVVMHTLLIEANEQEYLQQANHFAPGIIPLSCW